MQRESEPSMLIDQYVKDYHFSERHTIRITQPAEKIYPVIKTIDFTESPTIKMLFTARGLPQRMRNLKGFIESGFVLLEENRNEEILIGFIIHRDGIVQMSPPAFKTLQVKGYAKGAWNFHLTRIAPDTTLLSTQTRVFCTDTRMRLLFGLYWLIISPFSGLIRIKMLRLIKHKAEREGRRSQFKSAKSVL